MADEPTNMNFEQALSRLDVLVREMETGNIGLDDALKRYEEGVGLLKHCHGLLDAAEQKVRQLMGVDANGNPITSEFTVNQAGANAATGSAEPARPDADPRVPRPRRREGRSTGMESLDEERPLF
jgi:exodeoxyribonuclease VII small subunit